MVVMGASAGSLSALLEMVGNFPKKMDAAIVVVLHLSSRGISTFLYRVVAVAHIVGM
jgi:chemotaxis response regulator CheB